MTGGQEQLDMRAIELAQEAKAIAEGVRDGVERELEKFERINSRQHEAVAAKVDGLRDLVSAKAAELHGRIDRVTEIQASDREKVLQAAIDGRDRRFRIVTGLFAGALVLALGGLGTVLLMLIAK